MQTLSRTTSGMDCPKSMSPGSIYLIVLIVLFGGIVAWAFGRKRKKRFEKDGEIPFRE